MGADKGLIPLSGKPLVSHVAERLAQAVDEVIIVVCTVSQAEAYRALGLRVFTDITPSNTPLVGAYTGLATAKGSYTFLVAGDQPLLDPHVVELLFAKAEGYDAATPIWPNGWVEPLHTVYATKPTADLARHLIDADEKRLRLLIDGLRDVNRVPIEAVKEIDPELRTLMDVDTAEELERIKCLIEN